MSRDRDLESQRRQNARLAINAKKIVRVIGRLITSFVALKILATLVPSFPVDERVSWSLVQIATLVAFFSWFQAAEMGIGMQQEVLNSPGSNGEKLPFAGRFALFVGVPIGLSILFVAWFPQLSVSLLSGVLVLSPIDLIIILIALFSVWDALWHISVRSTMKERICASRNNLKGTSKRYLELEQIYHLEHFVIGRWRIVRLICSFIFIAVLLTSVNIKHNEFMREITPSLLDINFLQGVGLLVYILLAELSTWVMRIRTKAAIDALEKMLDVYRLSKA